MSWPGVIRAYREFLPVTAATPLITLQEGNTPLVAAGNLTRELGLKLYFKYEGLNPTGSFKDRGMSVAVSEAYGRGVKSVICASTGNTAASAAAYAARAGMRSVVIIPAGKVAGGKLAGAASYGAEVIQIQGSFDKALDLVVAISQKHSIALVNSLNPYRLEGQKQPLLKFAKFWGVHRIGWLCRSGTPEISLPTGWASSNGMG